MRAGNLAHDIIDRFGGQASRVFRPHGEWMDHLRALGLTELRVTPDPVRLAREAALWGAIEAEGLLAQAVIVPCPAILLLEKSPGRSPGMTIYISLSSDFTK